MGRLLGLLLVGRLAPGACSPESGCPGGSAACLGLAPDSSAGQSGSASGGTAGLPPAGGIAGEPATGGASAADWSPLSEGGALEESGFEGPGFGGRSSTSGTAGSTQGPKCALPPEVRDACDGVSPDSGGAGGGGGAGGAESECAQAPEIIARLVIDDFEDGDALARPLPGARGHWVFVNDETPGGAQHPKPCVAPTRQVSGIQDDAWALRTYACGFSQWGAGMALVLERDRPECPPAFEPYYGVEFTLASDIRGLPVTVTIQTAASAPLRLKVSTVKGSQRYHLDFSEFGDLDPTSITSLSWTIAGRPVFDLSLDNVGLY